MAKDVIIALDFENKEKTLAFLDQFTGRKPFVKIGMELFYAEGPDIVREIKARGHKIFLDLKLHDIPNTVKKAMKVLSKLDVDMTNLHAAGTIAMMEAAKEGLTKEDGTCGVFFIFWLFYQKSDASMDIAQLIPLLTESHHIGSLRWNSRWWAGCCPPSGATARHGAPCASFIIPPKPPAPLLCPPGSGSC